MSSHFDRLFQTVSCSKQKWERKALYHHHRLGLLPARRDLTVRGLMLVAVFCSRAKAEAAAWCILPVACTRKHPQHHTLLQKPDIIPLTLLGMTYSAYITLQTYFWCTYTFYSFFNLYYQSGGQSLHIITASISFESVFPRGLTNI